MKVGVTFPACILCLGEQPRTWEHVIPRYLGGHLQAKLICTPCNHRLGTQLVSALKSDPSIRMAFEALKGQLPSLYRKSQDKALFVGRAEDGSPIRASLNPHGLKVVPGRGANDSVIRDTADAANDLRAILIKAGAKDSETADYLKEFTEMPEGQELRLPTGHVFAKREMPPLHPHLSAKFADDRLWVLVAFEFLALIIGSQVYKPAFDQVRDHILSGAPAPLVSVTHLSGGKAYAPMHAILIEKCGASLSVLIRLFRWLSFRVRFEGLDYRALDSIYFEDLLERRSFIAASAEDARAGRWLSK